jgi:hypothetical protein
MVNARPGGHLLLVAPGDRPVDTIEHAVACLGEERPQRACGPQPGLPSTISKINAALRRALGRGAGPYLIEGGRGTGGYRITLPASAIQIVGRS